jgi:hypothetical protein
MKGMGREYEKMETKDGRDNSTLVAELFNIKERVEGRNV